MAFFMAKGGRKILTIIVCSITLIVAVFVNANCTKMNYADNNKEPLQYVKQDLKDDDIILFDNKASGFVISMQLPNIANCFYDIENWDVEPEYKAFGKDMLYIRSLEELQNYKGRLWIISSNNYNIYEQFKDMYTNNINLIKQDVIYTEYHGYSYSITLIDKM